MGQVQVQMLFPYSSKASSSSRSLSKNPSGSSIFIIPVVFGTSEGISIPPLAVTVETAPSAGEPIFLSLYCMVQLSRLV